MSDKNYSNYISLDLETTGLEPQTCDIIEIAMVKVRDGEIIDRFESFVFTPLPISNHVSYLTGISAKDIEEAPDFKDLKEKVKEFIGDDPLMGHNIWFDWNFLVEKGIELDNNELWDTYLLSNILYPELPSHSLETNTKYFNIGHEDSHRAMADVMACYYLWEILTDTFPKLSDEQRAALTELTKKSEWPLLDYFMQEHPTNRHKISESNVIEETIGSKPDQDLSSSAPSSLIHAPRKNAPQIAAMLPADKKTLYIAGYGHATEHLQSLLPEATVLHSPYSCISEEKLEVLKKKEKYDTAESMFLLKTILYPEFNTQEQLRLTHPERQIWSRIHADDEDRGKEDSGYSKLLKQTLESQQVITNHFNLLNDLELIQNFDHLVVLEPQLIEQNATRCFGKALFLDQWKNMMDTEDWNNAGESFFSTLDQLGKVLVPSSQYTEHVGLTPNIISSNEFQSLAKTVQELLEKHSENDSVSSYLKYFQVFFLNTDPSWVRWLSVDPRRGTSITSAPLSVDVLLNKHLFSQTKTTFVSTTRDHFSWLPENTEKISIEHEPDIAINLPPISELGGSGRDEMHQGLISYLAALLPQLKGKTGVIFSSKSMLKRYFFDLYLVISENMDAFAEDISGGTGKLKDRFSGSENDNKVIFLTYRNMRAFGDEFCDFDNMVIQCVPFDPPGNPVNVARSEQYNNAFVDYVMPSTINNMLEIVNNFTKRDTEKTLHIIDRRFQEKSYGSDLVQVVK
ncbi:MAG: exonuclease domain-containing protein [Candidatus Gracilibacteria bacterium]|nr:exonuclease domain-containing protein [Candidatus Gracilibacteria bacterium]